MNQHDANLASYAVRHDNTLGRSIGEPAAADRNEFQRDCSRIIHSASFRKLQYKTQVFSNHEGDLFRTRLSHSMEVAQVARSVARSLHLNEDLSETLALAHDLGHAPFGHLGQDVLNELMAGHGGFEHNLQALRIVDELERPYLGYSGLNLLFETREGILKHCAPEDAKKLGDVGRRFLSEAEGGDPKYKSPSLEAQLTDLSDAIAYTHADLEDGIRMKILSIEQVEAGIPRFAAHMKMLQERHGKMQPGDENRYAKVASGLMMKEALADLIEASMENIAVAGVATLADVRACDKLVRFSKEFLNKEHLPFKQFLRRELYHHPDVDRFRVQQGEMLKEIFTAYEKNPKMIPDYSPKDPRGLHRQISDYIAGMTDRFAVKELTNVQEYQETRTRRPRA